MKGKDVLALVATTSLASCYDLWSQSLGLSSVLLVLNPLVEESLQLVAAALASLSLGHELHEASLDLLVSDGHTETELAEVLEEGVGPSRTLTLGIGGVRSRRNRARID